MASHLKCLVLLLTGICGVIRVAAAPTAGPPGSGPTAAEAYVAVLMPPGMRVENSELDGPVFADASGHTLYEWPFKSMRSGVSGESKGRPACFGDVLKETAGHMSPYPAGAILPELPSRPSCTDRWKPAVASDGDKPVGKWSILERKDGIKQWAYEEQPLYTSAFDKVPGDDLGGTKRRNGEDMPADRRPVSPPSLVPPGFTVKTTVAGRLLATAAGFSVYSFDGDSAGTSACIAECARTWVPVTAPAMAQAAGEWSLIERSPGVRQWAFRSKPVYTYAAEHRQWSLEGSDIHGWRNVYTQVTRYPSQFTVHDTIAGTVLADARGMTLYVYICGDDSQDQLSCDDPDDTQAYRLAMCGAGDPGRCRASWPYVLAAEGDHSDSRLWSVMLIDPATGHRAKPNESGALRVWAYRDRPVYTYAKDQQPGDVNGDGTGEWRGQRNGLKAFWLRDDFFLGTI